MIRLPSDSVNNWTIEAYEAVRQGGYTGSIIVSDGFLAPVDFVKKFPQSTYPGYNIPVYL
jgi:hypothetical protein